MEKIKILTTNVCECVGYFCIYDPKSPDKVVYWDGCREVFARNFKNNSYGFFFVVPENKINSSQNFLEMCETVIDLKNKTKFFKTIRKEIVLIKPSLFWMDCDIKRSLFTLLCRISLFHKNTSSWEDTMFGEKFTEIDKKINSNKEDVLKTKNAIIRFFLGYTHFTGKIYQREDVGPLKHGWVQEFYDLSVIEIKKRLVKNKSNLIDSLFSNSDLLAAN